MNREEAKKKAEALVARMTLEEKASQLRYDAPAIKRLGIPAYNWWNEGLHGVARAGQATVFPQARSEWRQLLTGKLWQRWPVSWQQRAEQSIMHIP